MSTEVIADVTSEEALVGKVRQAEEEARVWDGGQEEGIRIWRIENFGAKDWPKEEYGKFFRGDSYIILNTYSDPAQAGVFLYKIHFWLGSQTSKDEAATAAFKSMELDYLLGTLPMIYRETEGNETEEFLSLFPDGITIMEGGIESLFEKLNPAEYKTRLFHVRGVKDNVRVMSVPVELESLNDMDVFVLDLGEKLIQWNGSNADPSEKGKAVQVCARVNNERGGDCSIIEIDAEDDLEEFWEVFGGKGAVKSEGIAEKKEYVKKLVKVSDESGLLVSTLVATGTISSELLDSKDVFLLDTEDAIYVWVGKAASYNERTSAFRVANRYIEENHCSFQVPVICVVEGQVCEAFEREFTRKTRKKTARSTCYCF